MLCNSGLFKVDVSIIVPIFNAEQYLSECLESLVNQRYSNMEIVLIDDGSTDNSYEICDRYSQMDKRIQVIHQPNRGVLSACIKGIKISKGKYIAFLDSDDFASVKMISTMVHKAEETKADIVQCGFISESGKGLNINDEKCYGKRDIINILFPQLLNFWEYNSPEIYPCRWNKIFKREKILESLKYCDINVNYGEDLMMVAATMIHCNCFVTIDKVLVYHRNHFNSITNKFKSHFRRNNRVLVKMLIDICQFKNSTELCNKYESYLTLQEILNICISKNNMKIKVLMMKQSVICESFLKGFLINNKHKTYRVLFYLLIKKKYCLIVLFYKLITVYRKCKLVLTG